MGAISAAMLFFIGYAGWVMIVLASLWLLCLVIAALKGHVGFGGKGNTDLNIVLAGMIVTAAIVIPNYNHHNQCELPKKQLRALAAAEADYFASHHTYTIEVDALKLNLDPDVKVAILSADAASFTATASDMLCDDDQDGTPDVNVWDSALGGLQSITKRKN